MEEQEYHSYLTAEEAFPICIPLEKADFGGLRYTLSDVGEVDDLELLYETETSHLIVNSSLPGRRGEPPGTLRISDIQAADISVFNEVPGSLEGLVARLVVETSSDVVFQRGGLLSVDDEHVEPTSALHCRRVVLTASIHECGHLRDMLLFLKSGVHTLASKIPEDNPYVSPSHSKHQQRNGACEDMNKGLTLMEGLPHWILYIPWRLYSGRLRKCIQMCLVLYTIFSVVWASWQLYRHFNIIQVALQPIVSVLKMYLSSVMRQLDEALDILTNLWTSLLSPLNIFGSIALAPLISLSVYLCSPVISLGSQVVRPFWQCVLNSRITVQSLDLARIRQSLVINLFASTVKAVSNGLAKLFNFHTKKVKQKQAIKASASATAKSPSVIFSPYQEVRRRSYPVYYSSPVARSE